MEQENMQKNIKELREEVNDLKSLVENISLLLNKKLIKELYKEVENINEGEYYNKEEFMKRHIIKTH